MSAHYTFQKECAGTFLSRARHHLLQRLVAYLLHFSVASTCLHVLLLLSSVGMKHLDYRLWCGLSLVNLAKEMGSS